MAAYVNVPRDLSRVKSKIIFNLTKRQLVCFGTAVLIGVPLFFLLRKTGNSSLATLGMIAVMLPFFLVAMYEKDGQPFEVVAWHWIEAQFLRPKVRPYQTNNYYTALMKQAELRKENNATSAQETKTRKQIHPPDRPGEHSL